MTVTIPLPTVEIPTCCGAPPALGTKFHFALNVADLERSVAFYQILFDVPPAKHFADYAKFELEQPPLVFSLVPNPPASAGSLSHFGFPVSSTEEVAAAAARLAAAGLSTTCQEGTVCGYARQDKVWVADPDHNHWEIYVVHEDVDPSSVRRSFDGVAPTVTTAGSADDSVVTESRPVLWEHRVTQPAPARIPQDDESVDEVRLEGTFNSALDAETRSRLLSEVLRVLKPGGMVHVHGLAADRPLQGMLPALPGVAALVKRVPVEFELLDELSLAGLVNVTITKLPARMAFVSQSVEMREIKLSAMKPLPTISEHDARWVIYKGPFAEAVDEGGQVLLRGRRTEVSSQTWDRLSRSTAAAQFVFLGAEAPADSACGTLSSSAPQTITTP